MPKSNRYQSQTPDGAGFIAYDAEQDAVWRDLMARQDRVLRGRVCDDFWRGLEILDLPRARVPQLAEVNACLQAATGFAVEPVPALITPARFFGLLAERRFPAATFLRRRADFDYLEEPDLFHEIYGHCPLLTNRAYADFLQGYGQAALAAGPETLWMYQRLFWFTVEFGLIRTAQGLRIYGAGIASSAGESIHALDSPAPRRQAFDALVICRTPYRIDRFQSVYYVIDAWGQLGDLVTGNLGPIIAEATRLGPLS